MCGYVFVSGMREQQENVQLLLKMYIMLVVCQVLYRNTDKMVFMTRGQNRDWVIDREKKEVKISTSVGAGEYQVMVEMDTSTPLI